MSGHENCQTRNFHCYLEETLESSWGVIHSDIFMAGRRNAALTFFMGLYAEAKR